jgi:hypothetical protein
MVNALMNERIGGDLSRGVKIGSNFKNSKKGKLDWGKVDDGGRGDSPITINH